MYWNIQISLNRWWLAMSIYKFYLSITTYKITSGTQYLVLENHESVFWKTTIFFRQHHFRSFDGSVTIKGEKTCQSGRMFCLLYRKKCLRLANEKFDLIKPASHADVLRLVKERVTSLRTSAWEATSHWTGKLKSKSRSLWTLNRLAVFLERLVGWNFQ